MVNDSLMIFFQFCGSCSSRGIHYFVILGFALRTGVLSAHWSIYHLYVFDPLRKYLSKPRS